MYVSHFLERGQGINLLCDRPEKEDTLSSVEFVFGNGPTIRLYCYTDVDRMRLSAVLQRAAEFLVAPTQFNGDVQSAQRQTVSWTFSNEES